MLIYPCFDWSLGLVLEGETTTKKEDIHRFQVYIYNIYIYIKSLTENTLLFSSTFFSHPTTNSKTLSEILRCDCRHYWPWFYDHKDFGGLMNWFAKKTLVFVGVKQLTPSPPKKKGGVSFVVVFFKKNGGQLFGEMGLMIDIFGGYTVKFLGDIFPWCKRCDKNKASIFRKQCKIQTSNKIVDHGMKTMKQLSWETYGWVSWSCFCVLKSFNAGIVQFVCALKCVLMVWYFDFCSSHVNLHRIWTYPLHSYDEKSTW